MSNTSKDDKIPCEIIVRHAAAGSASYSNNNCQVVQKTGDVSLRRWIGTLVSHGTSSDSHPYTNKKLLFQARNAEHLALTARPFCIPAMFV